jgi:hypothetical protein
VGDLAGQAFPRPDAGMRKAQTIDNLAITLMHFQSTIQNVYLSIDYGPATFSIDPRIILQIQPIGSLRSK